MTQYYWYDRKKIYISCFHKVVVTTGAVAIVLPCTIQQNPDFHLQGHMFYLEEIKMKKEMYKHT